MKNLAIPVSLALVAALAACGTPGNTQSTRVIGSVDTVYVASSGSVIMVGTPARSGSGTVVALLNTDGPRANLASQQVTMRMDDGSGNQSFAVEGVQLEFFENIRVNADGSITRRIRR